MNANITAIVFCPLLQQSVDGCELHAAACAVLRLLPVMPWPPLAGADAKLIHAFTDGSNKKRRSEPALASMMSLSSGATTIAMNEKPKKTQKMT